MSDHLDTASKLINRHIDGKMTAEEEKQLAGLMKNDGDVIDLYVRLMTLHGQLTWGASTDVSPTPVTPAKPASPPATNRRSIVSGSSAMLLLLLLVATPVVWSWITSPAIDVAQATPQSPEASQKVIPEDDGPSDALKNDAPLELDAFPRDSLQSEYESSTDVAAVTSDSPGVRFATGFSDDEVTQFIDQRIAATLRDYAVEPSPYASPKEFARRAWLTIAGRIPALEELPESDSTPEAASRTALIFRLVNSSERHQRLADVWTRLLVGRTMRQDIDRDALHGFLLDAFAENRSWMQIVGQLISAEGRSDRNGATNFLLAHLDNQATPATAVTARLFLGEQLQCVQCHDHPFAKEIPQKEYWAFNAFFQNAQRRPVPRSGRERTGFRPVILADRVGSGMTYFETRSGRQEAVLPRFSGHTIPANSTTARRQALAELLAEDPQHRVARAMVNRMWADFFGVGFTTTVDDMGPHTVVSHPELLEFLTEAFVASDYDVVRLQTWIANSDTWQRSSRSTDQNEADAPLAGSMPLFSRVYARPMAPEQVYDSVHTAVHELSSRSRRNTLDSGHRQRWVSQFSRPYGTDENDEAVEFNGGITQAMALMNGPDINQAVRQSSLALLQSTVSATPDDILKQVSLAVLSRLPTKGENAVFRRRLRQLSRMFDLQTALPQITEDMTWAYLNSSEFLLIH
jgi:hypothetical protein